MDKKLCKVPECDRKVFARSICGAHYQIVYKSSNFFEMDNDETVNYIIQHSETRQKIMDKCPAKGCTKNYVVRDGFDRCFRHMRDKNLKELLIMDNKSFNQLNRFNDSQGYVVLTYKGTHIAEHTTVLSRSMGRWLKSGESVHHLNGIRNDNRVDNLQLWVGGIRYGQRAIDIVCSNCGSRYA